MLKERYDSVILVFTKQKLASDTNIEEVIDKFKTFAPIKRRLELKMF